MEFTRTRKRGVLDLFMSLPKETREGAAIGFQYGQMLADMAFANADKREAQDTQRKRKRA